MPYFIIGGCVFLLIVYLIMCAIILLNGLIGIFGQAFTVSDEQTIDTLAIIKRMAEQIDRLETALVAKSAIVEA